MTNYFDFFGLPPAPTVDKSALKRTFYANSKRFHPDFHTLADGATQDDALEQSTINNQGYKVLNDDDRRLKHLLELRGVLGEEGSNQLPQAFLMEMMELNEAVMELKFEPDPEAEARVISMIGGLEGDLEAEVASLLQTYDDESATPADLELLKNYYLKKRYLRRLKQDSPEM